MNKQLKILAVIIVSSIFLHLGMYHDTYFSDSSNEYYNQMPDGMKVESKWLCDHVFRSIDNFPPKSVGSCRTTESFCKNTKSDELARECRQMGWE